MTRISDIIRNDLGKEDDQLVRTYAWDWSFSSAFRLEASLSICINASFMKKRNEAIRTCSMAIIGAMVKDTHNACMVGKVVCQREFYISLG